MSFVFLMGVLLTEKYTYAQASNKNKRHLQIIRKGEVKDDYGTRLNYISKEYVVHNNSGEKLGFIENGKVYDIFGNPLGKAKKNKKYYNNQGINILSVNRDEVTCKSLDPEGHKNGTLHRNYKLHSCSVHCYFLAIEKENEKEE